MGGAGEKREYGTNCQRFDNRLGTRKRRATELLNECHGLSALICSGFLARCRPIVTDGRSDNAANSGPFRPPLQFDSLHDLFEATNLIVACLMQNDRPLRSPFSGYEFKLGYYLFNKEEGVAVAQTLIHKG